MPSWDTPKGDLILRNKIIEVKGFMSSGPTSFGPNEKWDWIYFVDGTECNFYQFKVYEIKLSNTNSIWRNINLSSKETYGQIADANQRGKLRACFYSKIKPQIESHCVLIFNGHFDELII